jgi:hypothetical protein
MGFAMTVRGSVLLAVALGAANAYADGVCEKGNRDTTPAERQTMMGVMEAVKAALPLAPAGWVIGGYEELSPIGSICMDAESTPWAYGFSRTFNRTDDLAERERAMAEAAAAVRAARDARQPRMDALQVKVDAASKEFAAAAQSGDQARIAASQRAMDAISAEYAAFFAEAEDPQLLESVARTTMQDNTMSIGISVNPGGIADSDLQRVAPFAGAQSAYRWIETADGFETAHVLLLFGAWQPRDAGGMTSSRRGTASSSAAHAIAVRVDADPGRLDSLLATIDFGALAATLVR